jgi:predicted nucleotide-binding protein (sugar kinase/HSP70/actin superfamily)
VGEIYTVLEPAANYEIIKLLGRLGVEVQRSIYLSDWVNDHLLGGHVKKSSHAKIITAAHPYLNYWVGGHGQETIGSSVELIRQGCDGIIQIGPLTCMPEIVAQSILPLISEKEGIPCMTLWFDELSGTAGIQTRLEAFTDMVYRRKYVFKNLKEARA